MGVAIVELVVVKVPAPGGKGDAVVKAPVGVEGVKKHPIAVIDDTISVPFLRLFHGLTLLITAISNPLLLNCKWQKIKRKPVTNIP
jgi:hypothetical protein